MATGNALCHKKRKMLNAGNVLVSEIWAVLFVKWQISQAMPTSFFALKWKTSRFSRLLDTRKYNFIIRIFFHDFLPMLSSLP